MCGKEEGQRRREGRKELVNRQLKTLIEVFYVIQWQLSVSIKKELDQQRYITHYRMQLRLGEKKNLERTSIRKKWNCLSEHLPKN